MTSQRKQAGEDVATHSIWVCRTTPGSCVVRVDGVQSAGFGESDPAVLVVPAIRGAEGLVFRGSKTREVRLSGFLRRYKKTTTEAAAQAASKTRPTPTRVVAPKEVPVRKEQMRLFHATTADDLSATESTTGSAPMASWPYDAIVLNAGVGGPSVGLARSGFVVLGVDPDPETARAHARNGYPCVAADVAEWKPNGKVRFVFCALPSSRAATPTAEEKAADGAQAGAAGGAPKPADPRLLAAVRVASQCDAHAFVIEVSGGRRGDDRQAEDVAFAAQRAGFRTYTATVDPVFLGLPQRRPTRFVVGVKASYAARSSFRWPTPTHAPPGGDMAPFVTVRAALSLEGEWEAPDGEGPAVLSADAPCPTIGPSGVRAPLVRPAPEDGAVRPDPQRLGPKQVASLQGLPDGFDLGAEPAGVGSAKQVAAGAARAETARLKRASSAFPPVLAEAMARAVSAMLARASAPQEEHAQP